MSSRIPDDASEDSQAQAHASHIVAPIDRDALIEAIETERQRIFRARALAQTAAKLLHELFVLEKDEPDIGFVLDVVSDMLEDALAGLDRVRLRGLGA